VTPEGVVQNPAVEAFREWILRESKASQPS
jgi:microcystin degradation protein MlrC